MKDFEYPDWIEQFRMSNGELRREAQEWLFYKKHEDDWREPKAILKLRKGIILDKRITFTEARIYQLLQVYEKESYIYAFYKAFRINAGILLDRARTHLRQIVKLGLVKVKKELVCTEDIEPIILYKIVDYRDWAEELEEEKVISGYIEISSELIINNILSVEELHLFEVLRCFETNLIVDLTMKKLADAAKMSEPLVLKTRRKLEEKGIVQYKGNKFFLEKEELIINKLKGDKK